MDETTDAHSATPMPARMPCILVAEDEDLVRDLAVRVLSAHGFRVLEARHGGEALQMFQAHNAEIDAVLLDLSMPVMGGPEVLDELRKVRPEVRVVVTSGYADAGELVDVGLSPHVQFLQKPYRSHSLVAGVRSVLA